MSSAAETILQLGSRTELGFYSVVFVHELGSFPDSTWVKRKFDKAGELDSHEQISWVRDLLPKSLPLALFLYFNYDSTTYNDVPLKTLEDIADDLLFAFSDAKNSVRSLEQVGQALKSHCEVKLINLGEKTSCDLCLS